MKKGALLWTIKRLSVPSEGSVAKKTSCKAISKGEKRVREAKVSINDTMKGAKTRNFALRNTN